jgi:hypothetical protein
MSYNPFVALRWILDGKTVAGVPLRAAEETPTRLEALRHPDRGLACGRRQRGAERARRAGEDERFDCGGDGFLQKRQRAEDIDIDEIQLAMRGDVRLVQGRRVDDGAHARHARVDEIPIADRADAIGEWRRLDVHAARRPMLGAKAAHQRLAEVTGAPGYEDRHDVELRVLCDLS